MKWIHQRHLLTVYLGWSLDGALYMWLEGNFSPECAGLFCRRAVVLVCCSLSNCCEISVWIWFTKRNAAAAGQRLLNFDPWMFLMTVFTYWLTDESIKLPLPPDVIVHCQEFRVVAATFLNKGIALNSLVNNFLNWLVDKRVSGFVYHCLPPSSSSTDCSCYHLFDKQLHLVEVVFLFAVERASV